MGHPPAAVWDYSPRRIAGFLGFASRRRRQEAAQQLGINAQAARGEPREVNRQIREWSKP